MTCDAQRPVRQELLAASRAQLCLPGALAVTAGHTQHLRRHTFAPPGGRPPSHKRGNIEAATHSGPRVERMELAASTRKCKILALKICHQKIIAVLEAEGILELMDVIPSLSRGERAGRGRSGSCGHGQRSGISNPRFGPPGHTGPKRPPVSTLWSTAGSPGNLENLDGESGDGCHQPGQSRRSWLPLFPQKIGVRPLVATGQFSLLFHF